MRAHKHLVPLNLKLQRNMEDLWVGKVFKAITFKSFVLWFWYVKEMSNSSFLSLLSSGSLSILTAQVAEHHKVLTAIPELVKVSGSVV